MKELSNREKWLLGFVAVVMALCLTPLVGMIFAPTTQTTENKVLASVPSVTEDGRLNADYLEQLGNYFADHFALRQQLVSLDAALRGKVFGVSTVDSVVVGRDGWLFYSDTLNDFTGRMPMSERCLFNIANNLSITGQYVNSRGAQFIFTVAPNKNSLYPQFMPYTIKGTDLAAHNAIRLGEELRRLGVNYVDLFALFGGREEVLYLARDSHWNNDGALLAANSLLTAAGREEYIQLERTENEDYIGDLNSMLYPLNSEPEPNAEYKLDGYEVTNGARAADDPVIVTSSSDAEGTLLMYRDSFGNTLYPFMAQAFGTACFARAVPYNLGMYMDLYLPDTVIIEKVERSIDELAEKPPVLETPDTQLLVSGSLVTDSHIAASEAAENVMFWRLDGVVDPGVMDEHSRIFLRFTAEDGASFVREAFTVTDDSGDSGFRMYVSKDAMPYGSSKAEVMVSVDGLWTVVAESHIEWAEIPSAFDE